MRRYVIIFVLLISALMFAKFQEPDDEKEKDNVPETNRPDSKLWLQTDIKPNTSSELEKAEIKMAELYYQKEELEEQIQAELEKINIEKSELKKNEDELLRLTEVTTSEAEYETMQTEPDSLTAEEKRLLEEAEREYNQAQADSLSKAQLSQTEELPESIIRKNKLVSSAAFGIHLNNERESKNTVRTFDIPSLSYKFEVNPKSALKIYFYSDLGYKLQKLTVDGDAPDGMDAYESALYIFIDPAVRIGASQFYFIKLGLPLKFDQITPQIEDPEAYNRTAMNFSVSGGYDNRTEDIHKISPWDQFEEGLLAEAKYTMGIYYSVAGQDFDQLTNRIDMILSFSRLDERYNLMLKPYILFEYEMNDKIVDPLWLTAGIFSAWDYKTDININGYLNVKYGQIDPDNDTDLWGTETFLQAGLEAKYYVFNELNIFSQISLNQLLFADKDPYSVDGNGVQEDDPEIMIRLGLEYASDFRK